MKKIVAIYHKDCSDGTAAGAVVLKKFENAILFPLQHSYTKEDLQPILDTLDADTDIYTVDCCLGVKEILDLGFKVTSLDHHISAKEEFEKLAKENSNFTFIFDNNKSGASLSWSYFFPDEETPEIIKFVEDFDLWHWKYGDETKYVAYYTYMLRDDPESMLKLFNSDLIDIKNKGKIILKYAEKQIEESSQREPVILKIGEYKVKAYNIIEHASEIGSLLSEQFGETVILFNIEGDRVKCSFRSNDKCSPSALDLATKLGGGGHRNASGAKTTLKEFLKLLAV